MILDQLLALSLAQAVTATAVSTNTIDLKTARDLGPGSDVYFVFDVDEAATAAGAATVTFQIISSAAADLSSPTVIVQTDAIGKAELTLSRRPISLELVDSILAAQPVGQRYLGVRYVVATGPLTAGKFTCYVANEAPSVGKNYPSGFAVA
jgi:hypothetical protein